MKPQVLVTGGPVPVNLDAVKIITNRFKGGRMLMLADDLASHDCDVTYLTNKKPPIERYNFLQPKDIYIHNGFDSYRKQVLEMASDFDMVVLGAAVANLIPDEKWKEHFLNGGKFPSHDYKVDDVIAVPFRIAPRIIDAVKAVAPKTTLVGFKLLSNVKRDILYKAALETMRSSRADFVVANDVLKLDEKMVVNREHGFVDLRESTGELSKFLAKMARDEFYSTERMDILHNSCVFNSPWKQDWHKLLDTYGTRIQQGKRIGDVVPGCIALRQHENSFWITPRGKRGLGPAILVHGVDHEKRTVMVQPYDAFQGSIESWNFDYPAPTGAENKASLNAPFIARIFEEHLDVKAVAHWHPSNWTNVDNRDSFNHDATIYSYERPGTVRDSMRSVSDDFFVIEGHGTFELIREL